MGVTLAALGGVVFQIEPLNYQRLSSSMTTSFAEHSVLGAPKVYEHTGEGDRSFDIKGTVFPEFSGGMDELQALEMMRSSGQPQSLMLGSGFTAGWVLIKSIKQDHEHIGASGIGREVSFTLSLERCDTPGGDILGDLLGQFMDIAFGFASEYLG